MLYNVHVLENKPEKICALIGLKSCSYNSIGRAVAVMMAQAKRIYILMIEVKQVVFFFCRGNFKSSRKLYVCHKTCNYIQQYFQ